MAEKWKRVLKSFPERAVVSHISRKTSEMWGTRHSSEGQDRGVETWGGSVRLKRPMRPLCGMVRLKRPLCGSVRLKRLKGPAAFPMMVGGVGYTVSLPRKFH